MKSVLVLTVAWHCLPINIIPLCHCVAFLCVAFGQVIICRRGEGGGGGKEVQIKAQDQEYDYDGRRVLEYLREIDRVCVSTVVVIGPIIKCEDSVTIFERERERVIQWL